LLAQAAQAFIYVGDRREQRDAGLPLFRSVGLLHQAAAGAGGTAFLVGRRRIVTAFHVAFAKAHHPRGGTLQWSRPRVGHSAGFLIGPHPTEASRFAQMTRATVVAFGNCSPTRFEGMAGDWVTLKLHHCLGRRHGFLATARPRQDVPMPSGELMTIGLPRSRAASAGITVEVGCKARDHGPVDGLVGVDCAIERGMSGDPVLERQADGSWLAVGLVQQSMGCSEGRLPEYRMAIRNQLLSVSAFGKALDHVLRAEGRRVLAVRGR
jgi:hypothetical protein